MPFDLASDGEGTVFVALDTGVVRYEYPETISPLDGTAGLGIEAIFFFEDALYGLDDLGHLLLLEGRR